MAERENGLRAKHSGSEGASRVLPKDWCGKSVSLVSETNGRQQRIPTPLSANAPTSVPGGRTEFNLDDVLDAHGIGDPAVFRTPPMFDSSRPVPRLSCAVRRLVKDALKGWEPSAKELRTIARARALWNGAERMFDLASALCLASRQEVRRPHVTIACAALALLMDLEWVVDPDAGAPDGGEPAWPAGTAGYLLVHGPLRERVASTDGPVGDLVRLAKSQRLAEARCRPERLRQLESAALTAIDDAVAGLPHIPDRPISEPPSKQDSLLIELADGTWSVAFGGASATFPNRFQGLRAFRTLALKQGEEVPTIELDSDNRTSSRPRVTEAVAADVLDGDGVSKRALREGYPRNRAEDREEVRRTRQAIQELRERGEFESAEHFETLLHKSLDCFGRLRPPQDDVSEHLRKRVSKAVQADLPRRLRAKGMTALADHVEAHVTIGSAYSSYIPPKRVPWLTEPSGSGATSAE